MNTTMTMTAATHASAITANTSHCGILAGSFLWGLLAVTFFSSISEKNRFFMTFIPPNRRVARLSP